MGKPRFPIWDFYAPRHPLLGNPKPYHFVQHGDKILLFPGHHQEERELNG